MNNISTPIRKQRSLVNYHETLKAELGGRRKHISLSYPIRPCCRSRFEEQEQDTKADRLGQEEIDVKQIIPTKSMQD
jgi:hypothetical protein